VSRVHAGVAEQALREELLRRRDRRGEPVHGGLE
jgi:hypothetical protein